MKKTLLSLFISVLLITQTGSAQYWTATGAITQSGGNYLIAAANVGDNVYGVSNTQVLVYSTDKGVTWNTQGNTPPAGDFTGLAGTPDRLYAQMQINNYDNELYYTTDNGANWTLDTVGIPQNITNTGKASMNVKYMSNNYVIAYNSTKSVYKQLGASAWQPTGFIDHVITGFAVLGNKWLAVGVGKILQSTDNGANWTQITTNGLPQGFQGNSIAGNGGNRLFVANAPANGGQDIYFSSDGGVNWTLTNSGGHYAHANPFVGNMYAVDDYLFAPISPEFANVQDEPPFIISSAQQPSFQVGDVSGLPTGGTTTSIPFFFHIGNKLFTMFWDIHTSEPGFTGTSTIGIDDMDAGSTVVYPNPVTETFTIDAAGQSNWVLNNMEGRTVKSGTVFNREVVNTTDLAPGVYVLLLENEAGTRAVKMLKR